MSIDYKWETERGKPRGYKVSDASNEGFPVIYGETIINFGLDDETDQLAFSGDMETVDEALTLLWDALIKALEGGRGGASQAAQVCPTLSLIVDGPAVVANVTEYCRLGKDGKVIEYKFEPKSFRVDMKDFIREVIRVSRDFLERAVAAIGVPGERVMSGFQASLEEVEKRLAELAKG